jgi:hypothetical protein
MVPDKLITADCHITPPLSLVNELPEHYREYFPRIEKDENGKDVYKLGHIVSLSMMTGEGADSDIPADATGPRETSSARPISAWTPPSNWPTWSATVSTEQC